MISVLGIVILSIYFIGLLFALATKRIGQFKLWTLIFAIVISLFVNLGNFVLNFSFTEVCTVLCLFTCFIEATIHRTFRVKIEHRSFGLLLVLLSVVLVGHLYLILNNNMPSVLAMDINMDQAYYGLVSPVKAEYSAFNRIAFFDLLLFAFTLLAYRNELRDADSSSYILDKVRQAYNILFVVALVEFLTNNLISPTLIKDFAISLMGSMDAAKTYYPENRFGYYGISLLFSEQSYVSILIIYYAIVWKKHINNLKEMLFYLLSIAVLFMSGCSTGIVMLPIALILFVRECMKHKQKNYIKLLEWTFVVVIIIAGVYIVISNPIFFTEFLDSTLLKIGALIQGGTYTDNAVLASGATRNYANNIAWKAFLDSPLLGVGLGGTRGYGIWIAFAANFGILGMLAFIMYLNSIFHFSLKNKVIMFALVVMYFSIILSVWYIYMIAFVPVYLCMQKDKFAD